MQLHTQVYPVQNRSRNPPHVPPNLRFAAAAAVPVRVIAAGAGVHGTDQHKIAWIGHVAVYPGNIDPVFLNRLAQGVQNRPLEFRQFIQEKHSPRTGASCLCQTVRQLHIALLWGLTPVLNTPTPGVAVMGYIHPTKKGTPENYSILLGFLFILSIIITSFRFFNWWGQSEQNILQQFIHFSVFLPIIRRM